MFIDLNYFLNWAMWSIGLLFAKIHIYNIGMLNFFIGLVYHHPYHFHFASVVNKPEKLKLLKTILYTGLI